MDPRRARAAPGQGDAPISSPPSCGTCSTTCGSRSRTSGGWPRWPAVWPTTSDGEPGSDQAEYGDLLRWLAERQLPLPRLPRVRPGAGPRTAPACAPCRAPASASSATPGRAAIRSASCRPRWRAAPRTRPSGWCWPRRTRGPPSTGPTTWTTSRSRSSAPDGSGHRGVQVPRPVHARGAHRAHRRRARAPPQAGPGAGGGRAVHGTATTARTWSRSSRTIPREELFEISAEELTPIALGVLRLSERKQTRLFLRRDRYGRYMSCLVYLPRDRYTTKVRLRAQGILREALHGVSVDYSATVGDSALARLYVVVRGEPGRPVPQVDAAALERKLAEAVRSWDEDLAAEAIRRARRGAGQPAAGAGRAASPRPTRRTSSAADAVDDLSTMLRLRESGPEFAVRLVEHPERWTLVVYRSGTPITLSDVLPQLQHMGLEVVDEHPYTFTGSLGGRLVLDLRVRPAAPGRARLRQPAPDLRGRADRAVARPDRGRRVQRAGADGGPDLARGDPAARLRQVPAPGRDAVQRGLRAAGPAVERGHHPAADPAVRVQVRPGQAERRQRALRGHHRGDPRPARRGGQPRRRPDPALLPGADRRHPADQLLPGGEPGRRRRTAAAGAQARPGQRARAHLAAAQVRDLRLLAPAGGRAPALRPGGARRPALVGPARGLPHRGARPGQGAGGQERGHRPVRGQGRLRVQAPARPGRPRGLPGRGAGLLPDVHRGHARRDRQHRWRPGGAAARRGPARRRRPVPGGGGGQGHRDVLRHGQRGGGQVRLLARRRVRLRRLGGLRPQEDGHHRARRLGVGQVALRGARAEPGHGRFHRGRRGRHVRRRVRQRHAAVGAHPAGRGLRPPARVHRPVSPIRRRASPSARGCSRCPGPRGRTTTRR